MTGPFKKRFVAILALSSLVLLAPIVWYLYPTLPYRYHGQCPGLARRVFHTLLLKEYLPGSGIEFRRHMAWSGTGPENSDVNGWVYLCSDCVRVSRTLCTFASLEQAQEDMKQTLKLAYHVFEHKMETDAEGRPVLERAVFSMEPHARYHVAPTQLR